MTATTTAVVQVRPGDNEASAQLGWPRIDLEEQENDRTRLVISFLRALLLNRVSCVCSLSHSLPSLPLCCRRQHAFMAAGSMKQQPGSVGGGSSVTHSPERLRGATQDLFELLERVQSSRLDDQRCAMPAYFSQVS